MNSLKSIVKSILLENYNIPSPNNEAIIIGDVIEERKFVNGNKNWVLSHVELDNKIYKKGVLVNVPEEVLDFDYDDDDYDIETYTGEIQWIIITERGSVEVSIDVPLGRMNIEDLIYIG